MPLTFLYTCSSFPFVSIRIHRDTWLPTFLFITFPEEKIPRRAADGVIEYACLNRHSTFGEFTRDISDIKIFLFDSSRTTKNFIIYGQFRNCLKTQLIFVSILFFCTFLSEIWWSMTKISFRWKKNGAEVIEIVLFFWGCDGVYFKYFFNCWTKKKSQKNVSKVFLVFINRWKFLAVPGELQIKIPSKMYVTRSKLLYQALQLRIFFQYTKSALRRTTQWGNWQIQ